MEWNLYWICAGFLALPLFQTWVYLYTSDGGCVRFGLSECCLLNLEPFQPFHCHCGSILPVMLSPLHPLLAIISPALPLEKLFARPTNTAKTWTSGTIFTMRNQIFWTRRPCGQTNGTSNIIKLLFRCVPWKIPQCHNFWCHILLFGTTAGPQNQQMAYWSACQIGQWHSGGSWLVDVLNSHTFRFSIMMLWKI